jgi:hypothetical protein
MAALACNCFPLINLHYGAVPSQTPAVAIVEMQQCLAQAMTTNDRRPMGKAADSSTVLLQASRRWPIKLVAVGVCLMHSCWLFSKRFINDDQAERSSRPWSLSLRGKAQSSLLCCNSAQLPGVDSEVVKKLKRQRIASIKGKGTAVQTLRHLPPLRVVAVSDGLRKLHPFVF